MNPKRRRTITLRLCLLACLLSATAAAADEAAIPAPGASDETLTAPATSDDADTGANPWIKVRGSVWRTKGGIVFLKTPIGLVTLSSKTCLRDVRGSHEVTFWVHGSSSAVEIRKKADGSLIHLYLNGPLRYTSEDKTELTLWTPDGEKPFAVGAHGRRLAAYGDDAPVTVEVGEGKTILGVHDLQYDLQIGQVPPAGSDTHVVLTGTVSKLKSNFVFFRTPVGIVTVNNKVGLRKAKVGQDMALHMHQNHVAIDLAPAGAEAPSHRFLTGPLTYASTDKTELMLWTPDGRQTFTADHSTRALAGLKEGAMVTVELNAQGSIVQIHRLN